MKHDPVQVIDEKWMVSNWRFYSNPSNEEEITKSNQLLGEMIPKIPLCSNKTYFSSMILHEPVSKLKEETLYRCRLHNGKLYDALIVSHSEKIVYLFQSSNKNPKNHKFSYAAVEEVMNGLHMFDPENEMYRLRYIYCSDWSSKASNGILPKEKLKILTESKIKQQKKTSALPVPSKRIRDRLKIIIARVCYYPSLKEIIIT